MKLFSLNEAAVYLGIKPETVKYHIYQSGHLVGQKIGNSLVFTEDELDTFNENRPKPGPKPSEDKA